MREARAFKKGAEWALGTLAQSLIELEGRTKGRVKFDVQNLSDTLAPAIKFILQAAEIEADVMYPGEDQ